MAKLLNFLFKPKEESLSITPNIVPFVQPTQTARIIQQDKPTFILQRLEQNDGGTLGAIFYSDRPIENQSPICCTLERPWNNNKQDDRATLKNDSSCIPAGIYELKWTYSNHLKRETFELINVIGRSGIRIHAANVISELLGCIAPCLFFAYNTIHTNKIKYKYYGASSNKALIVLESILPKSGCYLEIKSPDCLKMDNPIIKNWVERLLKSNFN